MQTASPLTTLHDEQQLMTSLVELMKQEQQHLIGADTDALAALTARKSQLVNQMTALARQRHQSLAAHGYAPKEAGMQDWVDSGADAPAGALWQELLAQTREAKELNRVNGMLINKQMVNNQTVLAAMRTPTHGSANSFYGPTGQATSTTSSRRFVVG